MKRTIAVFLALFVMSVFGTSAIANDWNQNPDQQKDQSQYEGKTKKKRRGHKDRKKKGGKKKRQKNQNYNYEG